MAETLPQQSRSALLKRTGDHAVMKFARRIVNSKLVDASEVMRQLDGLADEADQTAPALAQRLLTRGFLTRWQAHQLLIGKTRGFFVDRYKVLELLAEGAMSRVFRAEHKELGRSVALKVLRPNVVREPKAAARFLREIKTLASIRNPGIPFIFDAGIDAGVYYMAMELIEGKALGDWLQLSGPIATQTVAEILVRVATTMHQLHREGFVHRDLKPNNLILEPSGQVRILDLGLVRHEIAAAQEGLTSAGTFCGTIHYCSPEQTLDPRQAKAASDQYSLGATAYHLLTGKVPFPGRSPIEVLGRQLADNPAPLASLRPDVPDFLARVIHRMIAKRPSDRFGTMADVASAIREGLGRSVRIAVR